MYPLESWVGKRLVRHDIVDRNRIGGLAALLDADEPDEVLPPLAHWLFAWTLAAQSELGDDGHPQRDASSFLPPVPLSRRMWAGSRVTFEHPIRIGTEIESVSTIASIASKEGRSGPMAFVTVEHEIWADGAVAIREQQDIVYRDKPQAATAFEPAKHEVVEDAGDGRTMSPNPVQLFRYSALTFNGHRIHYDRDYARDVEGYAGLVVHGPYVATLMLGNFLDRHPGLSLRYFSFRALAPLFDTTPFSVGFTGDQLWARRANGADAMTGTVVAA